MAVTYLDVEVANPTAPERTERIEFLVDSGATASLVSSSVLERLGLRPLSEQTFFLANGDRIVRKKGYAMFKYAEKVGVSDVIFGEPGDATLLGALTLESLGSILDPIRRELLPMPMLLARVAWR